MLIFNRGVTTPLQLGDGIEASPAFSFASEPTLGIRRPAASELQFMADTGISFARETSGNKYISFTWGNTGTSGGNLVFYDTAGGAADVILGRIATDVLGQVRADVAQEFRVYGAATGPKYLSMSHNAVDGIINAQFGTLSLRAASGIQWDLDGAQARLRSTGNSGFTHGTSALATAATSGFFMTQSCAGTPTGVPGAIPTGQIPMIYDTTNNKLYFYNGGWKRAQVTAVDAIYA